MQWPPTLNHTVADPGEGPGPPLFLDKTEARRAQNLFWRPVQPPPPYLRVWKTRTPPPSCRGLDQHSHNRTWSKAKEKRPIPFLYHTQAIIHFHLVISSQKANTAVYYLRAELCYGQMTLVNDNSSRMWLLFAFSWKLWVHFLAGMCPHHQVQNTDIPSSLLIASLSQLLKDTWTTWTIS